MPGSIDYTALLAELGSALFQNLRAAQKDVLGEYASQYSSARDLAIELPTGAGKSLIALLIGEAWRREASTVAILTGNKTLARQMEREARALGINAVRMEGPGPSIPAADKRAYQRGTAIAIMNYWVYFNQNPVIDPAHLLVMDDAHLAEHCLHSLFSVEVDRFQHKTLFESLVAELAAHFPEYTVLQDALDPTVPPTAPTELLSFLDQRLVVGRIREIIDSSPTLQSDPDLRFRWRRLRDRLDQVNIYASSRSLWFRPYAYPLVKNRHYEAPRQCLYMSATIGNTADLSRRLGARPITKIPVAQEHATSTYGRRMLIMNKIEDADIPPRLAAAIIAALQVHPKSVWLCASRAEAERYRAVVAAWLEKNGFEGHPTWLLSSLGDEIDEFKQATTGHLFVAGRFDGMDFKADECRLVVVATLPKAIDAQEEFCAAYLRDAGFMLARLNQRIIQALGRCNRAADDFGIYVLADRRFATHFGRESNRLGLPQNICAEIDSAEDATDIPVDALRARVVAFLQRSFTEFDQDRAAHLAAVPDSAGVCPEGPDTSADEVLGWTEMVETQNYQAAQKHFRQCAAASTDVRELGAFFQWCEAKAAFLRGQQGDAAARSEALDLLQDAIERGGGSSWFNRLRASFNRHKAVSGRAIQRSTTDYGTTLVYVFDQTLERLGTKGTRFQRWVDGTKAQLMAAHHGEYLEGLERLGILLGYGAVRPRHGGATDCRWRGVFGNVREVVTYEAKVEHEPAGAVVLKHVGQAHNQLTRAKVQYEPGGFTTRGTIVTHLEEIDDAARSSLGEIRVIRKTAVLSLWEHAASLLSKYRDQWSLDDVERRIAAAEGILPLVPSAGWLTRALNSEGPFLSEEHLLREWSGQT